MIRKKFVDTGFGFPVLLLNVPMVRVRGVWTPGINYDALALAILRALARKPSRLAGSEVRFVRLYFGMTLQAFASRFDVSHVAVLKWESVGGRPTNMNWTTEKDLRLFVLSMLKTGPSEFARLYDDLQTPARERPASLRLDAMRLAA